MLRITIFALLAAVPATAQSIDATQAEVDAFVRADRNSDGQISRSEFEVFMNAMADAGHGTAQTTRLFGAYDYAFSYIDANSDGVLSINELRGAEESYDG